MLSALLSANAGGVEAVVVGAGAALPPGLAPVPGGSPAPSIVSDTGPVIELPVAQLQVCATFRLTCPPGWVNFMV